MLVVSTGITGEVQVSCVVDDTTAVTWSSLPPTPAKVQVSTPPGFVMNLVPVKVSTVPPVTPSTCGDDREVTDGSGNRANQMEQKKSNTQKMSDEFERNGPRKGVSVSKCDDR